MSDNSSRSETEASEDEDQPSTSTLVAPGSAKTPEPVCSAAFQSIADSVADSLKQLTIETKSKEKTHTPSGTSNVRSKDDHAVPACLGDNSQDTSVKSEEYSQDTDVEESMDRDVDINDGESPELPIDDANTAKAGPPGSSGAASLPATPRQRPKIGVLYEQMVKELLGETHEYCDHEYSTEEEEDQ